MTTKKKWAVFDMDDVLTDFATSSYETMVALGYPDIPVSAWPNYNINDIYGLPSHLEFIQIMIEQQILQKSKVKEHALDTLLAFKEKGFHIGILTARGWHPEAQKITNEYVIKNELPVDKIVIAGHHTQGKLFYASQFLEDGEIFCYVDDSPKHIRDFSDAGIYAKLLRTSWISDQEAHGLEQVHSILDYKNTVFSELGLDIVSQNKKTKNAP